MAIVATPSRLGQLACEFVSSPAVASGARPPVVFIHGLGGGLWGWRNFQLHFAERGYSSYSLSLPSHGCSSSEGCSVGKFSIETYALYVAGALAELGPCYVIGHSMGGLIAQKIAESQEQHGFVFLASVPPWSMLRRDYWPLWRHLLQHPWREIIGPARGMALTMDRELTDDLINNRLSAKMRDEIFAMDEPDSGWAGLQMVLGWVRVDPLAINSPCLVVGGTADRLIPPQEQRKLARYYHCPLRLFDRGHVLNIEDGWQEVADGLISWIESVRTRRTFHHTTARLEAV